VGQAIGAYLVRNYQAVVDLLEARLGEEPELPGGQRTVALALARLNQEPEAVDRLREAIDQSPGDWLARAALASLLLRSKEAAGTSPSQTGRGGSGAAAACVPVRSLADEAAGHLEFALAAEVRPALRELLGAARWRVGHEALHGGRYRGAAREFAGAAAEFVGAAEASGAARQALAERHTWTFVGEAVALLLAGEPEAAQTLFARSPVRGAGRGHPLARFAAGLYELCDELVRATMVERSEATLALRDVLLGIRLEVGFYDGRQAVSLAWAGGPP
jgi:hypothetical protein